MAKTHLHFMVAGILLVLFASAVEANAQEPDATPPPEGLYTDSINGFSLHPPPGGRRVQTDRSSYLAHWLRRDEKAGETLWSLSVYKAEAGKLQADIRGYARILSRRIKNRPDTRIKSTEFRKISGRGAVIFSGVMGQTDQGALADAKANLAGMHFHQAWILSGQKDFLVVELIAVASWEFSRQAVWEAVLKSLVLRDPRTAIQEKKQAVHRGQKFLWEHVTADRLKAAMPTEPKWFLISRGGKQIGWLCVQGRAIRRDQHTGYEIRSRAMYLMPRQDIRLVRRQMFTDPKFSFERWRVNIQVGSGTTAEMVVEDGLRQRGLILSTITDRRQRNFQKTIPESVKDIYLPKAVGIVLPALVDLERKTSYTFAEYAGAKNDFNMRTFTVVGDDPIRREGKYVKAVKLTDQPAVGAEPIVLWVDERGNVLRSETPDGTVSDSATMEEVLRNFPKAVRLIKEMNLAERKARKSVRKSDLR